MKNNPIIILGLCMILLFLFGPSATAIEAGEKCVDTFLYPLSDLAKNIPAPPPLGPNPTPEQKQNHARETNEYNKKLKEFKEFLKEFKKHNWVKEGSRFCSNDDTSVWQCRNYVWVRLICLKGTRCTVTKSSVACKKIPKNCRPSKSERCENNAVEICKNGEWTEKQSCGGKKCLSNGVKAQCMQDWQRTEVNCDDYARAGGAAYGAYCSYNDLYMCVTHSGNNYFLYKLGCPPGTTCNAGNGNSAPACDNPPKK